MGKRTNIQAADLNTNLLETFIANQQQILQENRLLRQEVEQLKALVCSAHSIAPPAERVYTTQEVMNILHISRNTVTAYCKSGKLICTKKGTKMLFTQSNIDAFLNDRKQVQKLEDNFEVN